MSSPRRLAGDLEEPIGDDGADPVVRAIGRVAMPHAREPHDAWLARGLLWCLLCRSLLIPVWLVDGQRAYSCGPRCVQSDLAAEPVESQLLLGALIRFAVAAGGCAYTGPAVTAEEMSRWRACAPRDRRCVLLAAYPRIEINERGEIRPVWRHLSDADVHPM